MKCLRLAAISILAAILHSCSSSPEENTRALFGAVPADAEFVAVCNIPQSLEHSGAKIKDGKLTLPPSALKMLTDGNPKLKKNIEWLFSENSGVAMESAVFFIRGGQPTLIASLIDPSKFRSGMQTLDPEEWREVKEGDLVIYEKNKIFVAGDKVLIGPASPATVAQLVSLSETESFNSVDYAGKLSKSDGDLAFYGPIDGLMDVAGLGFSKKAQARMALGMFFNNPKSVVGSLNVDKNEIDLEAYIIDNRMKPSKCELKMSKISVPEVAALGGNANAVAAIDVSQGLVKQFMDIAASAGGALPKSFSELLSPLAGTIAVASSDAATDPSGMIKGGFRMSVATNGRQNAQLAQALEALGEVKLDGTTINVSSGSYGNGLLNLKDVADEFKDAWLGIAFVMPKETSPELKGVKSALIKAEPSDGTLKLKVKFTLEGAE